jgi:hypothetical protein
VFGVKTSSWRFRESIAEIGFRTYNSLSNMWENVGNVVSIDPSMDVVNNNVSFRVPQVVKDVKSKRAKNIVEKKTRKREKLSWERYSLMHVLFCIHDAILFNSSKSVPGGNNMFLSYVSCL